MKYPLFTNPDEKPDRSNGSFLFRRLSEYEAWKNTLVDYCDQAFYHVLCSETIFLSEFSEFQIFHGKRTI